MHHSLRVNRDNYRRPMPTAYLHSGLKITGEMDILPAHFFDPFLLDSRKELRCCSVIQVMGGPHSGQLYVYLKGMSLIRANLCVVRIEGIALFIVFLDNALQHFHGYLPSTAAHPGQKFLHIRPAVLVQGDPCRIGVMSQNQAEKSSQLDIAAVLVALILHTHFSFALYRIRRASSSIHSHKPSMPSANLEWRGVNSSIEKLRIEQEKNGRKPICRTGAPSSIAL